MRSDATRRAVALAALLACGFVVGTVPAAVGASDNAALFYFETNELDVDAGETVAVDLEVSTRGDHFGNGVDELSATIAYDADAFTVTDVEHGPMLADGDEDAEVDGSVDIDDDAGTVTIEQARTPAGDGAKATDTAATITLEVSEDPPAANETLELTETSVRSTSGSEVATAVRDLDVTITDAATDGDDTVPGFSPSLALAAVGIALLVRLVRR